MKIFQVVPYYPPHIGGMECYVELLSEELASRGHDVTVFTSSDELTQSSYIKNGVKIKTLKIMKKIYNNSISPSLITQLLTAEKPEIIHAHQYPVFYSDVAAIVSSIRKIPLILQVHVVSESKSHFSSLISNSYYSTLGLRTLKTAKTVIVPSNAYKTKLWRMHIKPNKLKVIPYGIDTKKFQNNTDTEAFKAKYGLQNSKIILSVGRLNYQKGFQYLVKAMPVILKQVPNAKLLIVGDGEQLNNLKQLSESIGINKSIIFTGALDQKQIPTAYSAANIFVLPSLFESFGISLVEAQAAGKPVIATRTGGTPEALVSEKTGFLVEPRNINQLTTSILCLLLDEILSQKMGMQGKNFAQKKIRYKQYSRQNC